MFLINCWSFVLVSDYDAMMCHSSALRRKGRLSWKLMLLSFFVTMQIAGTKSNDSTRPSSQASGLLLRPFFLKRGGGDESSLSPAGSKEYQIMEEKIVYKRWRTLINRSVRMPDGKVLDFDVRNEFGY